MRSRQSRARSVVSTSSSTGEGCLVQKVPFGGKAGNRPVVGLDEPVPTVLARGVGPGEAFLEGVAEDPGGVTSEVTAPLKEEANPEGKPPFRLPTMAEVLKARGSTGIKVVSTFSGCGGSCMGFEMAGFDVVYACEFVPAAQETYRLNHPGVYLDGRDVRSIRPEEILERLGLKVGELDVLEGSPPCASFSTAGKREKGWGQVKKYSDTQQRTDDLFFEFARLLEGLKPKAFVAENVSGMVKGKAYGYFVEILNKLRSCGYRVKAQLLDAQWLGVPQMRQRLIFVGVREDLGLEPVFPKPMSYRYSMRDALPHLQRIRSKGHGTYPGMDSDGSKPAPTVLAGPDSGAYYRNHLEVDEARITFRGGFNEGESRSVSEPAPTVMAEGMGGSGKYQVVIEGGGAEDVAPMLEGTAIGEEWDKLKPGETSERFFSLVKPNPDNPVPTITAAAGHSRGTAGVTHPTQRRKFTIRELKRLCAFPDDFQLLGSYAQQWERMGRSVPPRMMFHVARTLRDELFTKLGRVQPGFTEAP